MKTIGQDIDIQILILFSEIVIIGKMIVITIIYGDDEMIIQTDGDE